MAGGWLGRGHLRHQDVLLLHSDPITMKDDLGGEEVIKVMALRTSSSQGPLGDKHLKGEPGKWPSTLQTQPNPPPPIDCGLSITSSS